MSYIPVFGVGNAYVAGHGVVAMGSDCGHAQRKQTVGGEYDGSVAKGLFWKRLILLYDNALILCYLRKVCYWRAVERGKQWGGGGGHGLTIFQR